MKKLSLLICALTCAGMISYADPVEVFDVNFALSSNGAVATAKSGNNPAEANDGNAGTRWWSATDAEMTDEQKNDQWWQVDLGQARIFNTIQILWEGAWGKSFDIQISNDGNAWTTVKSIVDQTIAGPFPYAQTITLEDKKTAQYVRFQGVARGTQYAYSFWEFKVYLPGPSVLTTIELSAAAAAMEVGGAGVALTTQAKDQNNVAMDAAISYEITPSTAGHMNGNTYIADQIGSATIKAYSGEVYSSAITVCGYKGSNLALSTDISTDNKVIAQSDFAPNGTDAFHAVDANEGSVWQGSPSDGTSADEEARTFDAWFVLDLGGFYDINLVTIKFEGACSELYHLDFSADNSVWNTGYNYVGAAGVNGHTDYLAVLDHNTKVRYVRFWSTKAATQYGMKVYDMKVYGTEWVDMSDTEKPVMVKAELESKSSTEVVIRVEATDNVAVKSYHVVDATNGVDANLTATDGKIMLEGLAPEKEYTLTVTAIDATGNESDNSKTVNVKTDKVSSEYCAKKMSSGNTEAAFVWETDENGAVIITILETLGGADEATHFRGDGIKIEKITVGESKEPAATYFNLACGSSNTITLSLKDPNNAPAVGTKIYVTNQIIEYTTSQNNDAWPTLSFEYSYGRICTGEPELTRVDLSAEPLFGRIGDTIRLASRAVDQLGKTMSTAITYELTPADAGKIENDTYIPAKAGMASIVAKADTKQSEAVKILCYAGENVALEKSVEASGYDTLANLLPANAVDANENSQWSARHGETGAEREYDAWITVDLNDFYDIELVAIKWEGACSKKYHVDFSADNKTWRTAYNAGWDKIETHWEYLFGTTENAQKVRYVRVWSTEAVSTYGIKIWDMKVFATDWVPEDDKEKPVMVKAELVSVGIDSAVIRVEATDNYKVKRYHVVDAANALDTVCVVAADSIILRNLKSATTYALTVTAIDLAGLESENKKEVSLKTEVDPEHPVLPAPAPKPELGDKQAAAVFCDAIAGGPAIGIGGWGQNTVAKSVELAEGDHAFYLTNTNYLGWELTPAVDATGMNMLHVDLYSDDMTAVSLTPISQGPKEGTYNVTLKAGEWNSFDIPLSAYPTVAWNDVFQFKFMNATPEGTSLYIDNVYFYSGPQGIEGIQPSAVSSQKVIRDGQIMIVRGGKIYSILGQTVK